MDIWESWKSTMNGPANWKSRRVREGSKALSLAYVRGWRSLSGHPR